MAEDDFHLYTGSIIITIGILGVFMNSTTLSFFYKLDTRDSNARKRMRTALVNTSLIDLVFALSACTIRGPGFIWPEKVYGSNFTDPATVLQCQVTSVISTWFLSDLNMLAIIPISCICVFHMSRRTLNLIILLCWTLPGLESILLVTGIATGKLDSYYTDTYKKCSIHNSTTTTVDWARIVDTVNTVVFQLGPVLVHIIIWVSLCCTASNLSAGRIRSGFLVVCTATLTWLPYGIVYGIEREDPEGSEILIYIFFYISVVTNPLIYGYIMYRERIFTEGCSECCCGEEVESYSVEQRGGPAPAQIVQNDTDFTDMEEESMKSSVRVPDRAQWNDEVGGLPTSSTGA